MFGRITASLAAGLVAALMALPAAAEEWIMANGHADADFHTKNIRTFISASTW